MSKSNLAPFFEKQKSLRGMVAQGGGAVKVKPGAAVQDAPPQPKDEAVYAAQRKSEAWWGNRPHRVMSTEVQQVRPSTSEKERAEEQRKLSLLKSAQVLERLMRQKTFLDGDQELLASAFNSIDNDQSGRIDYDEFWEALAPITQNLREQDKQELFLKVDQDCSGSVDLFAFLNFFLVTSYEQLQRKAPGSRGGTTTSGRTGGAKREQNHPTPTLFPDPTLAKPSSAGHKDIILGMYKHKQLDQYATVSRDGALYCWSKDLKFQRSLKVADPRIMLAGNRMTSSGFITATCMTPLTNLIAVASMKRVVRFYDLSTTDRSGVLAKKDEVNAVPTIQFKPSNRGIFCLSCCPLPNGNELLIRGSDEGRTSCQILKPGWHRVEGASTGQFNEKKFNEEFCERFSYSVHHDWVTKAEYVDSILSIVTSGHDNCLALMDIENHKIKWKLDSSKAKYSGMSEPAHTRGIRTWDFSPALSIFVTGGVERTMQLWSPFVNRPVGNLVGSNSSAVAICINDDDNQIVTLGADKTLKVWDIRTQKCVSSIAENSNQLPEDMFSAMYLDKTEEKVLLGSGRPLMYTVKRAVGVKETFYAFIAVAVSSAKNLVAIADEFNEIRMFRAGSGRGVFSFNCLPVNEGLVTALGFDSDQVRLIVAANDGFIRLFNHGNGMLLKQFALMERADVGAMISTVERGERLLYCGTDAKELYIWKDTDEATTDRAIQSTLRDKEAHTADIADVCAVPPETIITSSFDGNIVVWASGTPVRTMADPENDEKPIMVRGMLKLCSISINSDADGGRGAATTKRRGSSPERNSRDSDDEIGARGEILLSAGSDGHVHVWDVWAAQHLFKVQVFKSAKSSFGVVQMCVDPTASFLFCGDAHGIVRVFDISQLKANHAPASFISLHEFRAHTRSLMGMNFIESTGPELVGSGALLTMTKFEMRLWTIEGQHIGQFGRDHWDLSIGQKMPLQKNDLESEEPIFIEEDDGGANQRLSTLWVDPASVNRSLQGNGSDDSIETVNESMDSAEEGLSGDEDWDGDEIPVRQFASDELLLKDRKKTWGGKSKYHGVMPKGWNKAKRYDTNMFGKIPTSNLAQTEWMKIPRAKWATSGSRPSSNLAVRPSKHKVRMEASIRELRETPIEFRPGFIYDDGSVVKPKTPEVLGFSRTKVKLPDRSVSSMM